MRLSCSYFITNVTSKHIIMIMTSVRSCFEDPCNIEDSHRSTKMFGHTLEFPFNCAFHVIFILLKQCPHLSIKLRLGYLFPLPISNLYSKAMLVALQFASPLICGAVLKHYFLLTNPFNITESCDIHLIFETSDIHLISDSPSINTN